MTTPTYAQLADPTQAGPGFAAETYAQRLLTIAAMIASGQNPDGTAAVLATNIKVNSPTGVPATDANNIQIAINTALSNYATQSGPTAIQLQAGTYKVTSFGRYDPSVTFVSGTTWTDTAMTAADATRASAGNLFVLAPSPNNHVLRITSVNPGVGFTTDAAPASGVSAQNCLITQPGIVIPPGRITINGMGGVAANVSGNFNSTNSFYGTAIVDSGTGVTVLCSGSDTLGTQGKIRDLVVWGGQGVLGTALVGIYIGNSSWMLDIEDVDTSWQAQAGLAMDGNMNSLTFRRWTASNIGSAGTTLATGGALVGFITVVTSAALRFEECVVGNVFGMGIGCFFPGNIGALACKIADCQVYDISLTPSSPIHAGGYDGFSLVLQGGPSGQCSIDHSWFGTNNGGDLYVQTQTVDAISSVFSTNTVASPVINRGNLTLHNVSFSAGGSITNCVNQISGTLNYDNCFTNGHPLTSTISAAAALGTNSIVGTTPVLTKSASYTILTSDPQFIVFTVTSAATATLPSAVTAGAGIKYVISNANASTVTVTLAATAGTIPLTTIAISQAVTVVSDGTNWQRGA